MKTLMLVLALTAGAVAQEGARPILTPKPGPEPVLRGPKVYGARPGRPFLYRIPCTGERPLKFTARALPYGLTLDGKTGILGGRAPEKAGEYVITLEASNAKGRSRRALRLVVGEKLALTPPMGWNDWYSHYDRITDKLVREAADRMVESGMADFGYQYVNIDDCWMVRNDPKAPSAPETRRTPAGDIRPNKDFPDMPALTAYIHSKGLKAGIYASPGPRTCAGYEGSYQHEAQDAKQFAAWGFDFLKYDWCSYGKIAKDQSLEERQKPYRLMGPIVAKLERDVVFNLCQYGMGDVWKWGASVQGHAWRTTGDLGLEKDSELPGFYSIGFQNAAHFADAGPGHWNDPDYILIGSVGDASNSDAPAKMTKLTADEQYSYMSMWALMAAPLIYSGEMGHLDEFTLNVLCNGEVIDVDQDALGRQARVIRKTAEEFVLARELEDGSLALGLFNLSKAPRRMEAAWPELGLTGSRVARDVWRQKDTGSVTGRYAAEVAAHGVVFVRLKR